MFRMSTKLTNLFNYVKTQGKNGKAGKAQTSKAGSVEITGGGKNVYPGWT